MDKGIFPTFAFPLDVAKFKAKGTKKEARKSLPEPHTMQQHLRFQGFSEYSPGHRVY